MRRSIKGRLAVPKEVWSALASANRDFVESLSNILKEFESQIYGPLGDSLKTLIDDHAAYAQIADERRAKTKRGRPSTAAKPPSTKVIGGPRAHGIDIDIDITTFKAVEYQRHLATVTNKSKPTIKAAIDALNAEIARDAGKAEHNYVKDQFSRTHAAYQRGKKRYPGNSKP